MDIALLILRIVVGLLFVGHGAQKLFGWFGGGGLSGTAQWLGSMGFNPPRFWAAVAGLAEFSGGLGLAVGFLTPIAAAAIIGVMLMATFKVHWPHGLWNSNNGYELPLINMAVALVLGLLGAGQHALDRVLAISYPMPLTFVVALAGAIVVVLAGLFQSRGTTTQQTQARAT